MKPKRKKRLTQKQIARALRSLVRKGFLKTICDPVSRRHHYVPTAKGTTHATAISVVE